MEKFRLFNPLTWSVRTIEIVAAVALAIFVPTYIYFGLQPVAAAEYSSYPTLEISSIGLSTPVEAVSLEGKTLTAPATIAGSYSVHTNKTLLIGHSSTVFSNLKNAQIGNTVVYNSATYKITGVETVAKSEISMSQILAEADRPTLVLMTCAGELLPNQDATHRLIVYAEQD